MASLYAPRNRTSSLVRIFAPPSGFGIEPRAASDKRGETDGKQAGAAPSTTFSAAS
jgi:hypothetical protein